jgi:hypothetical protein
VESWLLVVGMGMVVGAVALVLNLVAWWQRRTSTFTVDDEDDGRCVACGADGVVVVAPGVYVCGCGHEGGPGMAAYQWSLRAQALRDLPAEEQEQLVAQKARQARESLQIAQGALVDALRCFEEGAAILALGKRAAQRKVDLFDRVRALTPDVQQHLQAAIEPIGVVRQLRGDDAPMTEWYDRLGGSRETVLTVTAIQATAALKQELQELEEVLRGLTLQLDGVDRPLRVSFAALS